MIKACIVGTAGSPVMGELLSLLIQHPDVETTGVYDAALEDVYSVLDYYPSLAGDTELHAMPLSALRAEEVDVVFGIDSPCAALVERNPALKRVVLLSDPYGIMPDTPGCMLGLPELNRRYIVRECDAVVCPPAPMTAAAIALLPLAKHLLLKGEIGVTLTLDRRHLPAGNDAAQSLRRHLAVAMTSLQSSFNGEFDVNLLPSLTECRTVTAQVVVTCGVTLEQARELYSAYYDDHRLTFVVERKPTDSTALSTAKCFCHVDGEDGKLVITTALDAPLKGAASAAVHNMNLLFGLHERVGLMLKPIFAE